MPNYLAKKENCQLLETQLVSINASMAPQAPGTTPALNYLKSIDKMTVCLHNAPWLIKDTNVLELNLTKYSYFQVMN